jgi:hypothetical protein
VGFALPLRLVLPGQLYTEVKVTKKKKKNP